MGYIYPALLFPNYAFCSLKNNFKAVCCSSTCQLNGQPTRLRIFTLVIRKISYLKTQSHRQVSHISSFKQPSILLSIESTRLTPTHSPCKTNYKVVSQLLINNPLATAEIVFFLVQLLCTEKYDFSHISFKNDFFCTY